MSEQVQQISLTPEDVSWSRYWEKGALHSCPGAFIGNYGDNIGLHWQTFFGTLPDKARILDIGTGNGAVAFLACEVAQSSGRHFHIEGIDSAVIHPAAAAAQHKIAMGGVVFRGLTHSENTGYPDACFDAVSSQYAIEYTRVNDSLKEIARVLKPEGVASFIIHHADSEAVKTTQAEIKVFEFLRKEAPLLAACRRLLQRVINAEAQKQNPQVVMIDPESRKHMKEIEKLLERVRHYAHSRPHANFAEGIAIQVARTMQQTPSIGAGNAMNRLDVLEQEMGTHLARLQSMLKAACTRDAINSLRKDAATHGLKAKPAKVLRSAKKDLLGWIVDLKRVK